MIELRAANQCLYYQLIVSYFSYWFLRPDIQYIYFFLYKAVRQIKERLCCVAHYAIEFIFHKIKLFLNAAPKSRYPKLPFPASLSFWNLLLSLFIYVATTYWGYAIHTCNHKHSRKGKEKKDRERNTYNNETFSSHALRNWWAVSRKSGAFALMVGPPDLVVYSGREQSICLLFFHAPPLP